MALQTPETPIALLIANCVLIGSGMSAGVVIPYQLLPFVADVDELMTTEHRAGTYAGAMTLLRKLIQGAIVLPLMGFLLSAIGYVSHSADEVVRQAPETLNWLRILFVGTPALAALAGAFVSFLFALTPRNHRLLRDEIERLRSGGEKTAVEPETRRICELLTGKSYDTLYPRRTESGGMQGGAQ
jgi:oligogalacturonide transporter